MTLTSSLNSLKLLGEYLSLAQTKGNKTSKRAWLINELSGSFTAKSLGSQNIPAAEFLQLPCKAHCDFRAKLPAWICYLSCSGPESCFPHCLS